FIRGSPTFSGGASEEPVASPVPSKPSALFDEVALLARAGSYDVSAQIAEAFFEECPSLMTPMRNALRRKDAPEIARLAHALKGAIANFTSGAAFHSAVGLEQFAKEGDITLADLFKQLEKDVEKLLDALQNFVRAVPGA